MLKRLRDQGESVEALAILTGMRKDSIRRITASATDDEPPIRTFDPAHVDRMTLRGDRTRNGRHYEPRLRDGSDDLDSDLDS